MEIKIVIAQSGEKDFNIRAVIFELHICIYCSTVMEFIHFLT